MGRRFKITEEQYLRALSEDNTQSKVELTVPDGDSQSLEKARNIAKQTGQDKITLTGVNGQNSSTNEGKVLTKKQIEEARIRKLKEHAIVLTPAQLFHGI